MKIGEVINITLPSKARLKLNKFSKKLKNNTIEKMANKTISDEMKYSGHSKNIGSNSAISSCWKLVGNKLFLKLKINSEHKKIEVIIFLFLINVKDITLTLY